MPRSGTAAMPWFVRIALMVFGRSPEALQPTADARVAPGRILVRHADHQCRDVWLVDGRRGTSVRGDDAGSSAAASNGG